MGVTAYAAPLVKFLLHFIHGYWLSPPNRRKKHQYTNIKRTPVNYFFQNLHNCLPAAPVTLFHPGSPAGFGFVFHRQLFSKTNNPFFSFCFFFLHPAIMFLLSAFLLRRLLPCYSCSVFTDAYVCGVYVGYCCGVRSWCDVVGRISASTPVLRPFGVFQLCDERSYYVMNGLD